MTNLQEQRVTTAEIAEALNYTPDYFSRLVPDFIADHGMPRPLPSSRRRARIWSRPAIEHWLAAYADQVERPSPAASLPEAVATERQGLHLAYVNPAMDPNTRGPRA